MLATANLLLQSQMHPRLCCADDETSELETLQLAMTNSAPGKKKRGDLSALEKAEAEHEARQKQGASHHIWAVLCNVAMHTQVALSKANIARVAAHTCMQCPGGPLAYN